MPEIIPCGDSEIDAVRARVGQNPTQTADYPYHVAILTTWINLLHRQGADLADYAPIFDELKSSRDDGDIDRLCATIDEAFAFLDAVQTSLEPPTATQVKPVQPYAAFDEQQLENWSVYGGNPHLTSYTPNPGPTHGAIAWQKAIGLAWYARPAVADGRAYIPTPGQRCLLHCVDLNTGDVLWQTRREWTPDALGIVNLSPSSYVLPASASTPVIVGDSLLVNQLGAQGRDLGNKHILQIDRATGEIRQKIPAGEADYRIGYAPMAANEHVVVYPSGTQRAQERPPQLIGQNRIICKRTDDHETLWDFHIGPTFCEPVLDGNHIFTANADGMVFCLRAEGASGADHFGFSDDRRVVWQFNAGAGVNQMMTITNDHAIFGSWDHYVYALHTETGKLMWQFHTGGSPDSGAPIAYDDKVYVPVGGNRLYCLDRTTGTIRWTHHMTDGDMNASPALAHGKLYISMGVRPGAVPIASRIQCLDAETGAGIWEHTGGGITGPSVGGGRVFFGSTSAPYFYCVDAHGDGTTICHWQTHMSERVYESVPAIYGDMAHILNENGYLFAFD